MTRNRKAPRRLEAGEASICKGMNPHSARKNTEHCGPKQGSATESHKVISVGEYYRRKSNGEGVCHFVRVPLDVITGSLKDGPFRLYCMLLRHISWKTKSSVCYVSQRYLAKSLGITPKTVQRRMQELREHKLLRTEPVKNLIGTEWEKEIRSSHLRDLPNFIYHILFVPDSTSVTEAQTCPEHGPDLSQPQSACTAVSKSDSAHSIPPEREPSIEGGNGPEYQDPADERASILTERCKEATDVSEGPDTLVENLYHYGLGRVRSSKLIDEGGLDLVSEAYEACIDNESIASELKCRRL